jgi:hypothetical protein
MNRSIHQFAFTLGAALLAAACANPGATVSTKENMLASAGLVPKKADNPTRLAVLKSLPPHQFVARTANGATRYLYADPTVCGCVYVGGQAAYDRYRQQMPATGHEIRAILSSTPLPGEEGLL